MEQQPVARSETNVLAIVSLALGIVALVLVLVVSLVIGGILGLIALGIGNAGLQWSRAHGGSGKALAIAGMVIGGVADLIFIVTGFLID
jgi:hypothetical protein